MDGLEQKQQAYWKLEHEDSSWMTTFDPSKKKKKKKKKKPLLREGRHFSEDNAPQYQSEPDYGYKELLSRVFGMLLEDDLEVSTESPRTVMPPPQLLAQEEHTSTVCLNFAHLCKTMHRNPDHVMRFLLGHVETKGFLNKQLGLEMNCLVSSHDFQAMFRRYIDVFVICTCCKSPDTVLGEGNGLLTLRCDMCGLVASIKQPNPL